MVEEAHISAGKLAGGNNMTRSNRKHKSFVIRRLVSDYDPCSS